MTTPRPINLPPPRIIKVGEEPPPMTTARPTPSARRGGSPKGKAQEGNAATASSRYRALNTFVDESMAYLGRNETAVWLVLFRDAHGLNASTSIADLARRAGCHRATVMRVLKRLQAAGLVRRLRRGSSTSGLSLYRVCGELLPELRARLEPEG